MSEAHRELAGASECLARRPRRTTQEKLAKASSFLLSSFCAVFNETYRAARHRLTA